MHVLPLHRRGILASRIALGCMGLGGGWDENPIEADHVRQAHAAVDAALEAGINLFDHADIYMKGKAERVFGQVLKERPGLRERILVQSKCGIRFGEGPRSPGRYDFSRSHILRSVDGTLGRLGVERIDILLLHRPDPLMDPAEVADALDQLNVSGKVRWFGVSNMSAAQIRLLQHHLSVPLIVNQLEMSLAKIGWLQTGVHVNQDAARANTFPEDLAEFCSLQNIQVQAWGPLAQGLFSGRSVDDQPESVRATARLVGDLAREKATSPEAIVLAWLMAHPLAIQPIIGTKNPQRILACAGAERVALTREEWYALYVSSRGRPLP